MVEPAVKDPSDPKQVKKGKDLERFLAARELSDFRWMMSVPQGRRFLRMFLGNCGIHSVPFDKDPIEMARLCGKQSVGKTLQEKLLRADPYAFLKLFEDSVQDQLVPEDEEKKEDSDDRSSND